MVFGFGSKKSDISFDFPKMHVISDVNMDNAGESQAIAKFCRHNNINFEVGNRCYST